MKRVAHAALGVAVFAALVLLAVAVALPRWVASDALRVRFRSAGEAAFGRELRYERLDLAWLPPALVMIAPRVAGAGDSALSLAEAPSAVLHLAPAPSLAGPPWIDRLVVAGATLRLAEVMPEATLRWELRALAATLRRAAPDAPLSIDAAFELAGGGRAVAHGSATPAGVIDLEITLDAVDLASAAPQLGARNRLAGAISGTLALAGPFASPDRISARLLLSNGAVQLDEIALRGALRVELELVGPLAARSGSFALDASDADLEVGRGYRKPPGIPATVRGRIVAGKHGSLGVDDVKLHIGDPRSRKVR